MKPFPEGPVPFVRPLKAVEAEVLAVLTKEVLTVEKQRNCSLKCLLVVSNPCYLHRTPRLLQLAQVMCSLLAILIPIALVPTLRLA